MKTPVFEGSSVAIVTPMKNGAVHYGKLEELLDFQIENGTAAITICGTTGESATLSHEEHLSVLRHTIRYVNGRCKVICGTGSNETAVALHMSQEASDMGADGLLMVTPYYNKTTQKGLVQHYTYVADRVNTPIILYNVPSRTGLNIAVPTLKTLSQHPNINGIKEASGNFSQIAQIRAACGDDLNVWSGNDDQTVAMMALGAKGVISVFANICPKESAEMTRLCLDGDFQTAAKLQLKYLELMNALFVEVNPIPVKTAMNLLGFDVGELRMPLCEMEPKNLAVLKQAMDNFGLKPIH